MAEILNYPDQKESSGHISRSSTGSQSAASSGLDKVSKGKQGEGHKVLVERAMALRKVKTLKSSEATRGKVAREVSAAWKDSQASSSGESDQEPHSLA